MWLKQAFEELGVEYEDAAVKYSRRFKPYNANVRHRRGEYEFRLSKQWESVDEEIRKGVVQHLLRKIHDAEKTAAEKLYNHFLREVGDHAPRKPSPPGLVERFKRLNKHYFDEQLDMPNLEWGTDSLTKLGHYHYGTDTVRVSTALREAPDLLDFVLYHELLHKKHKFTCTDKTTRHHTKAFREDEQRFALPDAEKKLRAFVARKKRAKNKSWLPFVR